MKLSRAIAGLIGMSSTALAAGCAAAPAPVVTPDMIQETGVLVTESTIQPVASGWAVGGTVRILSVPGSPNLYAEAHVTGLTPGEHAWHLHSGTCENPGSIVVPFSTLGTRMGTTTALNADSEGVADGLGPMPADQVTRDQIMAGDYAILIHNAGGTPPGRGVACSDL